MSCFDYTQYVNTNIGTIGHLLQATTPNVQSPHGAAVITPAFRNGMKDRYVSDKIFGFSVGGAQVSEKHAGFIINTGSATSSDIYSLIGYVRTTVKDKTGYDLVPEVRFLGDFDKA